MEARNRALLRRFPSSELWRALSRPWHEAALLYYRWRDRREHGWRRLDLVHAPDPRLPGDPADDAAVWAALVDGAANLEVRSIVVSADHPPLRIDDESVDNPSEHLRRRRYPLVEPGHLVLATW